MERVELQILVQLLPVAEQYQLSARQVVGMIDALALYMRESKRKNDAGGMVAAVRGMLSDADMDVPPMWELLTTCLGVTRYRDNVARNLEDVASYLAKVEVPHQASYRVVLTAALDAELAKKAETKKAIQAMKAKWNKDQDDEEEAS